MMSVIEQYLQELAGEDGWITPQTADWATRLYREIRQRVRGLATPNVAPGPDGVVGFVWRNANHFVGLDVGADGNLEAFHENLRSGELWSEEALTVPDELVLRLEHLV